MNTLNDTNKKVILELKDVKKSFTLGKQEIEIIKGVSFEIYEGDFTILFGPSGCGKSTILNILLGLEPPTSGIVHFLGDDIYKWNEDQRAIKRKTQIGMVYQQSNWIKSLNVLENVAFPLTLRGMLKEEREGRTKQILDLTGMLGTISQKPSELSSGQQQRVSLGRALVLDPALIVADEPTGNLDSKSSMEIMNLFRTFNENGKTIIMVTHDLEYLKFASRSIQMADGIVVNTYNSADEAIEKLSISKRGGITL